MGLGSVKALTPAKAGTKRPNPTSMFADVSFDEEGGSNLDSPESRVQEELKRWRELPNSVVQQHRGADGIIDHYSLFTEHRANFPILFALFRQVAPGITHSANVERVNSSAKQLADPNMNPSTLSDYVYICRNVHIYGGIDFEEVAALYRKKWGSLLLPEVCVYVVGARWATWACATAADCFCFVVY
jgi:hypothetical protein